MVLHALVMTRRESTGPIDTPWGAQLRNIEKRIRDGDTESIRARWESGQHILKYEKGKQLPKGTLKHLCQALQISQSEISLRVRFARTYPTDSELSNAVTKFRTWKQIITKGLLPTRTRATTTTTVLRTADIRRLVRELEGIEHVSPKQRTHLETLRDHLMRILG